MGWGSGGKRGIDAAVRADLAVDYIKTKEPLINKFVDGQTNLQAQVDKLVVSGDSSPAAAQASVGSDATVYPSLKARLDAENNKVTSQLADTARQTTTLSTGVSVVNAEASTPARVEIEGRTLVNINGRKGLPSNANDYSFPIQVPTKVIVNGYLKATTNAPSGFIGIPVTLESGKFYVATCILKNEGSIGVSIALRNLAGTYRTSAITTNPFDTVKLVKINGTADAGNCHIGMYITGSNTTAYQKELAIYEVTAEEYAKIGIEWNDEEVARRYPYVDDVKHLQGAGVFAEGDNLLPPFTEWALHANARVISPYELELNATGVNQNSEYSFKAIGLQTYTVKAEGVGRLYIGMKDKNGVSSLLDNSNTLIKTFTAPLSADLITVHVDNYISNGAFTFKNPMLTLGSTAKPFVPRNPSYVIADVKLGAIGTSKDLLYKQDDRWLLRKSVEKDVVLDGSLAWGFASDYVGFKAFKLPLSGHIAKSDVTIKHDGLKIKSATVYGDFTAGKDNSWLDSANLYITVSDADTGFADALTPTASDNKRHFNGWKYTNGTTWTSVTGNGQTATAQQALDTKPTDYTPYKLSYVLATPQTIDVTDKVEGSLKVNGLTQTEVMSGVIRREKAKPVQRTTDLIWFINVVDNNTISVPNGSQLTHKLNKFLALYKNGIPFNKYGTQDNHGYGNRRLSINNEDFDPKAEYTITYTALDKHLLTANPTNVKLTYAKNIRGAVDDTVNQVQDNSTMLSVHEKAIVDLYVRVKALEVR